MTAVLDTRPPRRPTGDATRRPPSNRPRPSTSSTGRRPDARPRPDGRTRTAPGRRIPSSRNRPPVSRVRTRRESGRSLGSVRLSVAPLVGRVRRPVRPISRPDLRLVEVRSGRRIVRRRRALVLVFVGVLAAFFAVALVHAGLVEGQQQLDEMRGEISELQAERAALERELDQATAPDHVVERATGLGMVRAEDPVFLSAAREAGGE
ncbi:MAG: FtsB family cell division protein [Acidimicrobiales bacterium]